MAAPLTVRAIAGIPGDDGGGSAAIAHDRSAEVIGTVCNNAQKTSRMRVTGISTAQKDGNISGSSKARSSSLGEAVHQPVSPPVEGGEEFTIALHGDPDGKVRLVSGHPDQFAAVHDGREVFSHNVRNLGPDSGKWSVVVSGAGWRCQRERWTATHGKRCEWGARMGTG